MTQYSPAFRLWEGAQGDPAIADAWATPLVENFTLLEAAMGGSGSTAAVNVNGLATYSLTTLNGAPDEARPMVQSFSGALIQDCTVTLPNVEKIGYALNATTGGRNIILTSGAGTTVSIPADGSWHFFRSDGAGNVAVPSVRFGTGLPQPISGTTGNFTGAVTIAGLLTGSSAAFSGNLTAQNGGFTGLSCSSITCSGSATISGSALLGNTLQMPNNTPIQMRDSVGTLRNVLYAGNDNWTNVVSEGTGVRFLNRAQTISLFEVTDAGAATFAGAVAAANFTGPSAIIGGVTLFGGNQSLSGTVTAGAFSGGPSTIAGVTLSGGAVTAGGGANFGTAQVNCGPVIASGGNTIGISGFVYAPSGPAPQTGTVGYAVIANSSSMVAVNFYASSDEGLKDGIADITPETALDWVSHSRPVTYTKRARWDDEAGSGVIEAGFIAQEQIRAGFGRYVQSTPHVGIPARAYDDGLNIEANHALTLPLGYQTAYLTAALKALMAKHEDALTRIEALERRVAA